jgi:hypothetical protein
MTTEQAKQLSESALKRLMAALEQGHSAALKQYLAVMSRFRKNSWVMGPSSSSRYIVSMRAWICSYRACDFLMVCERAACSPVASRVALVDHCLLVILTSNTTAPSTTARSSRNAMLWWNVSACAGLLR